MKARTLMLALGVLAIVRPALAQEPTISFRASSTGLELFWQGQIEKGNAAVVRPYFELQQSFDLQRWEPIGERLRVRASSNPTLSALTTTAEPRAFYRLLSIEPTAQGGGLGSSGAEVFGYSAAFAQELQRIGQISPDEFAAMFPTAATYLKGISWDPMTGQFWDQFNTDIDVANEGKQPGDAGYRTFDCRLNPSELQLFKTNGFVVSERLGANSFAEVFYNLWHNDLPVFISCDALLQAWHRTYDAMLEEVEETYLFNSMGSILDGMASQLAAASTKSATVCSKTVCSTRIISWQLPVRFSRAQILLLFWGRIAVWQRPLQTYRRRNSSPFRTSWGSAAWSIFRNSRCAGTTRIRSGWDVIFNV